MSFGFRVGPPGFKVRVSNRGVRTSVGTRAARVSFGTGRTRVSSGFGPFFASTSLGGSRRRYSTSTRRSPNRAAVPSAAQLARAERAADRTRQDAERDAAIAHLTELRWRSTTVHLQDFPTAQRPIINPPSPVPLDSIEAQAIAHHLQGLGFFARSDRNAAKERARYDAQAYADDETRRLDAVFRELQAQADHWWAALGANDEFTVCEAVNTAFSDNPAAGCAVGASGSTLSIVMRQQDIDSLPTQTPGLTSAGRPTLKALTKKDRVAWWLTIMASNLVATAKEAFAIAPGITDISVAVLSRMPDTMRLGVVAFGTWTRAAIESTPWQTTEDAYRILDIGRDVACSVRTTASGALSTAVKPLDVDGIPGLTELLEVNAIDDGIDTLGELDSAMATNQAPSASPDQDAHPYALTPFLTWLTERPRANSARPAPVPAPVAPPSPAPQHLIAGQTLVLPEHATFEAHVALSYQMRTPEADADLSLILCGSAGKVGSAEDFIFYNNPATANRSLQLAPKAVASGAVTERADLHLSMLPPHVTKVVIALSMDTDGGLSCGAIDLVSLSVTSGTEGWLFQPNPDPAIKAMIGAEFYRHRGSDGQQVWKLRAVGQGWAGGLAELARTHGIDVD
jgi:stress response protein SCP2